MTNKLEKQPKSQYKSLKIRIYPNSEQASLINRTFGCCRKIYNLHLQERNEFYIDSILPLKEKKASKSEITHKYKEFKPTTEKQWKEQFSFLKDISAVSLQQARKNCDQAFMNFFKSRNGSRKGKSNFPKFKSKKDNHQSYTECMLSKNCFNFFSKSLIIPRVGKIGFSHDSLPKWFANRIKLCNVTVEKCCSGKYYASLLYEVKSLSYNTKDRKESIGLDFSPELFYVDSESNSGKDFGYIAQKQAHSKKLRKLQRSFARKQMLKQENSPRKIISKNREKVRNKLAKLEEHIANSRKDFIEKESLRLVTTYSKVVVEDLNLIGISKFLRNAKNMNDTSWATFSTRLEQKGKDYRCEVVKADRWFPSSQLCSNCGYRYHGLKLLEREWTCPSCGKHHVRDVNAAINLKNYIPQELRNFRSVEDTESLASLALGMANISYEAERDKATSPKKMPSL